MKMFKKSVVCLAGVLWLLFTGVYTYGQITTFPYTESFDATTLPTGWTNVHVSSTLDWATVTSNGNSTITPRTGERMAEFRNSTTGATTKLVTPQLDLTSVTNPQLKFYYANVNWFGDLDILKVYYKTSASGSWVQLGETIDTEHTQWTEFLSILPNPTADYYIAFEGISDWARGFDIDDVTIEAGPTCPMPNALFQSGTTSSTVNLTWTPTGSETVWNIQWGAPGFTPGTGTEIGSIGAAGSPSANVSTLTPATSYHFYVQADCGGGDLSSWRGPVNVSTLDIASPAPFYDDFSTSQWVFLGTGVNKWCVGSGTGNTGNSLYVSSNGTSYAYNTSSATIASHAYKTVSVPSSTVGTYKIRFDWKGVAEGSWDFTRVWLVPATSNITPNTLITTGNTTGAVQLVASLVGGTNWANVSYNVPAAFLGTTFKVVFEWKNDSGGGNTPTAIDNFAVYSSVPSPAISQSTATPDCVIGTELSTSEVAVAPVVYYWQETATGTSTTNDASTPWNVMQNGTYYVRAYNSFVNEWSTATSYTVTNIPSIAAPPVPLAAANPACVPGTEIVMVSVPAAGVEYYWQGNSNIAVSLANPASTPYNVTETGTYYVRAFEAVSNCWSDPTGLLVTINTTIPATPATAPSFIAVCEGVSSIELSGQATGLPLTYKLRKLDSANDGWSGNFINVLVNGEVVLNNVTLTSGGLEDQSFTVAEGDVITTAWVTTGSWASEVSYSLLNENNEIVGGQGNQDTPISYTVPMAPYTLSWYDAPVGGNLVGAGVPFEAVGSSVIGNVALNGSYSFYLASNLGACQSVERALVEVNVTSVNVGFETEGVTCNNGNDGTLEITEILCGVEPFSFSVDGGDFGSIPTDLTVGQHTVVVKDANENLSATYTLTIGNALAPFNVTEIATTNNQSIINWTAPGSEIQWNVVWGPIGFTPGDADQIGSATATDTTFIINNLEGNTEYDIYVSADCGNGTVAGDWNSVSIWTECDAYNLPFIETFEDNSSSIACWTFNGSWDLGVGSEDGGPVTTAFEGQQNAYFGGGSSARLISPVTLLTGQDSVAVIFAISQAYWPSDQNTTTLAVRNGTSAPWTDVKTYLNNIPQWMVDTVVVSTAGMDSLQFSFFAVDEVGYNNTIDDFKVEACFIEPTADGNITVCRSEGSIDLTTVVTPMASGVWNGGTVNSFINGSMFNISNLMEGTYEIKHIAKTACASDTALITVTITAPVSAGIDGTLNVCKNQTVGLFNGLSGNVDYGGTWYTASGVALTGSTLTTGTLQGQQVYTYVVSNGICGADTSQVIVNITSCNFLGLEDVDLFENLTVSPNPSTGLFTIEGVKSPNFTYEVVDLNARVIVLETKITSSVTSVNLTDVETGVYMIRLKGDGSEKMIRLIKQ